jgi:hypothetical protein
VNFELPERRVALTVCHAINIAITVVFPAPVANLSASRKSSGFASAFAFLRYSINRVPILPILGATSASQIAVSTASTWQKNGRMSVNGYVRQCFSSRSVSGVTSQSFGFGNARQRSTCTRSSLMTVAVRSYCCLAVEMPVPLSSARLCCCPRPFCLRGFGMGVMNSALRRVSTIFPVGWPESSSSQCSRG